MISVKRAILTCAVFFLLAGNISYAHEAVLRKILDNGLTFLVKESAPKDLVTIDVTVRAAPKYEGSYLGSGMSHFVEHMVFKGTATRKAGDIEKEARSYGAILGGAVSSDFTSYQVTVPAQYLPNVLGMLKDMLLNASFDPVEMEKEREVILKEVKLNEDDPQKKTTLSLFLNSYIKHPYRYPAIGYENLLKGLTRSDLINYYTGRYTPNNIVIAVVGGIDQDEAAAQIEKEFKDFRRPDYKPPYTGEPEPPQLGKKAVEIKAATSLSYMMIGFHSTGLLNKDLFAMDVLSMILGRGNNSRLNIALVEQKRTAHSVSASNFTPEDPGLFVISLVLDQDNIEASRRSVMEEIQRIKNDGIMDAELEAAKNMVLSDYILSRETIEAQASDMGENETITGNYDFSRRYVDGVKKVAKIDVRRAAIKYLDDDNMTEVTLVPRETSALEKLKVPPPPTEEKIEKKVLDNGLVVLARRDAKIPAVSVTIAFTGGLLAESSANNGISSLVSKMLLDGTTEKREGDIKGGIEERGGEFTSFSGFNSFGVSFTVLKGDVDFILELSKDIVTNSAFPQDELSKEKLLAMASIKEEDSDIFEKGVLLLRKGIFENYPYSMRYAGEMESVHSLQRDDLLNFYHTYCVPNNMVISVSGDIDPQSIYRKIESLFRDLPSRELPKRPALELPAAKAHSEIFKMDKEQTLLILGFRTVSLSSPDRYPLDVLDTILSGMSGRLFSAIRERSGLAYTLGCSQKLGLDTGFMLIYVATTKENVGLVKEKLYNELRSVRDTAVSDGELAFAKREALSSYKMLMQTNSSYSFQSALDELYGLGYDILYKYEDEIKKVTTADVKRVAGKYLDLSACTEIIIEPE